MDFLYRMVKMNSFFLQYVHDCKILGENVAEIFPTVLHQTISFFQIYLRRIESFHAFLNWK